MSNPNNITRKNSISPQNNNENVDSKIKIKFAGLTHNRSQASALNRLVMFMQCGKSNNRSQYQRLLPESEHYDEANKTFSRYSTVFWTTNIFLVIAAITILFVVCGSDIMTNISKHYSTVKSVVKKQHVAFPLVVPNQEDFDIINKNPIDVPKQFLRPKVTKNVNCKALLDGNDTIIKRAKKRRITFSDPKDEIPMDCKSIFSRNYFPNNPYSDVDASFPLAEARVIYEDYLFVEMELAAGYAPQNWYCFAIDAKSSPKFHSRMRLLANCLPNVLILPKEYRVDRGGHNITSSYLDCMRLLLDQFRPWKYITLLQNHDISLRTNSEMVQIMKWLNGANDVELTTIPGGRYDPNLDWSFKALHLFRNESWNNMNPINGFPPRIAFSKGNAESTLSREMVDFMLNTLNLTEFLNRVEHAGYGTDEIMIPTLHAMDALQAPGGFSKTCAYRGKYTDQVTRYTIWYGSATCLTRHYRHGICMFGVEDLSKRIKRMPFLFLNKMMPNYDFGAIVCWYEELFRRSYLRPKKDSLSLLEEEHYTSLPHVRFQTLKSESKKKGIKFDYGNITCNWLKNWKL